MYWMITWLLGPMLFTIQLENRIIILYENNSFLYLYKSIKYDQNSQKFNSQGNAGNGIRAISNLTALNF